VAPVRHVVGLGDSVPAGTACGCRPYVALVADALARTQHADVTESNLAVPGLTTQGLLTELDQSTVQRAVRGADLTIVTIGANDFDSRTVTDADCGPDAHLACYRPTLLRLGELLDRVVDRLQALGARPGAGIVLTGYWNVFRDGQVGRQRGAAYVRNSDALTTAVDDVVAGTAARTRVTYVDVYQPFKGDGDRDDTSLLAPDGDHPNADGHRVIAEAIAAAVTVAPAEPARPVS
jgi:lysophospholipase L1-like esterase